MLPIGPTTEFGGNSPYSALSAFAIDPIYISLEVLEAVGLVDMPGLSDPVPGLCNYAEERKRRSAPLRIAFERWSADGGAASPEYTEFLARSAGWLPDYALYIALRERNQLGPWFDWADDIRDRQPSAIESARAEESDRVDLEYFLQFVADRQWSEVRRQATERGIALFGDLPIYVSWDSADVWVERADFKLDAAGRPTVVSGVPPDYFSETGQRWGNPIYRWSSMEEGRYRWWFDRLGRNAELFDIIRLDHFRAFESYWEVPASEPDAVQGKWVPGPGKGFFDLLAEEVPDLVLVAEDLGIITDEVRVLRAEVGLPGMRVLQFGFGEDFPKGEHLPHRLEREMVLYTGTHDNNTAVGWFKEELGTEERKSLRRFIGRRVTAKNVHQVLCRTALASVCDEVILPLQDVLGLDGRARMNHPGVVEGNWSWRSLESDLTPESASQLRDWTEMYDRLPGDDAVAEEEVEPPAEPENVDADSDSEAGRDG